MKRTVLFQPGNATYLQVPGHVLLFTCHEKQLHRTICRTSRSTEEKHLQIPHAIRPSDGSTRNRCSVSGTLILLSQNAGMPLSFSAQGRLAGRNKLGCITIDLSCTLYHFRKVHDKINKITKFEWNKCYGRWKLKMYVRACICW